jgi:Mce-associated membrane protein
VPSFRRRDSVIDADRVDESTPDPDHMTDAEQARALVEEAEAEAAEADALAAAARARARAARLRRQALADEADKPQQAAPETVEVADTADAGGEVDDALDVDADVVDGDVVDAEAEPARTRRRRIPRPSWKALAATVAILCTLALLALSGLMVWKHQGAEKLRQQQAEYAAAGRQSVVTLMSLDFNKAEEDVQRIIDNSTGQFKTDFESQAADFVKVAQDSKVITEVSVNSTAVESMSDQKAVVLVAASSRVTNTAGAQQEPRTWRLSVNLEREGDQIKMAKVEFVP